MLALAQILGLLILNALIHRAFTRLKNRRRAGRAQRRRRAAAVLHYPQHPSPVAHVRPAGIDW